MLCYRVYLQAILAVRACIGASASRIWQFGGSVPCALLHYTANIGHNMPAALNYYDSTHKY